MGDGGEAQSVCVPCHDEVAQAFAIVRDGVVDTGCACIYCGKAIICLPGTSQPSRARRDRAQQAGHADAGYSKPSLKISSSPSTCTPSMFPCSSPPAASFSMPSKTSSEFTGRS